MFSFRNRDLPINRELCSALQTIKGVGFFKALFIVVKAGFGFPYFISNLNIYSFFLITYLLKVFVVSELKVERDTRSNVEELIRMGSYKGVRHFDSLPVRGQRTRTNASCQKSKR